MDFVYVSLGITVLLLLVALFVRFQLRLVPGRFQTVLEMLVDFFDKSLRDNLGKHSSLGYFYFFTSLFLFLLVANMAGLVPGLKSPTADVSVTAAFALVSIFLVQISNIRVHGFRSWVGHFFKPFKVFVFINVLELFTRPLTLALRLYGNIFAGEKLLEVLYGSVYSSILAPVIWLAFSVFIGVLQAYIFTALSMAYTGSAMAE